jgi:hypothetical protein
MSGGDHDINNRLCLEVKIDVHVLSGMAMIMIAIPTNAAHPRRLYKETKARVI